MDLQMLKLHLRIDESEEDSYLALLVEGAKGALADAGVPELSYEKLPETDPDRVSRYIARYEIALMQHVAMNYEGREATSKPSAFTVGWQSLVLQLQIEARMLLGGDPDG